MFKACLTLSLLLAPSLSSAMLYLPCVDDLVRRSRSNLRHGTDNKKPVVLAPANRVVERVSVLVPVYRELRSGN